MFNVICSQGCIHTCTRLYKENMQEHKIEFSSMTSLLFFFFILQINYIAKKYLLKGYNLKTSFVIEFTNF